MIKKKNIICSYRGSKHFVCKGLLYFSFRIILGFGLGLPIFIECQAAENRSDGIISSTQEGQTSRGLEGNFPRPKISVVIDDLGAHSALTQRAIAFPNSISLAFLPNSSESSSLAAQAINVGHEVLIHMPMEPLDPAVDPGAGALFLRMTFKEVLHHLRAAFTRIPGAVGLNNHMGSKFTQDENGMATLMGELKARDMIFLDSRTTSETKGYITAKKRGVRTVSRDVFLDNDRSETAIREQLLVAEKVAGQTGSAVVIGHPYQETFSVLEEWIPDAVMRGYILVPISTVAR